MEVPQPAKEREFTEGVRLRVEPAPVLKRLVALAVDLALIMAISYLAILVLVFVGAIFAVSFVAAIKSMAPGKQAVLAGAGILMILAVVLAFMGMTHFYFIYFELKKGATPGKRIMGLRVVSLSGGPITRNQAIYRDFIRWYVDLLLVLPALISIYATKHRQRVGDLLADTMVVHSKVAEEREKFLYVQREDYVALYEHLLPEPVPVRLREDFLAFAGQHLLEGHETSQPESVGWIQAARAHLRRSEELALNDFTVLRFFAELCFQEDLKENQQGENNG